ncbi:MAG: helix-turn-helix transcriptional regulator [Chloroflexota bacterium]|nr:helix-turn-helix transcriptional regulator [Chloroflexota bacterium]
MTTVIGNSNSTETTNNLAVTLDGQRDTNALQDTEAQPHSESKFENQGKTESELRAAARRKGLTLKELAALMAVNYSHLCSVANGRLPWTPDLREKVMAVLGEVPGQGVVYRPGGRVGDSGSNYIREQAREVGLSMGELADRVGISRSYLSQAARGDRHFGPQVQARVEAELQAPVKVEAAQRPTVDPRALWDRMDALGLSQNEVARRVGVSNGYLSQIMNGKRTPSGNVLRRLYEVLFRPSGEELVVPAELKVLAWKKGGRNGVVVRGAGGPGAGGNNPGGGTIRIGGHVPWGAEVEFAYTSGYDSRGRVTVTHFVDERGYGVMLQRREPDQV